MKNQAIHDLALDVARLDVERVISAGKPDTTNNAGQCRIFAGQAAVLAGHPTGNAQVGLFASGGSARDRRRCGSRRRPSKSRDMQC
jgi:hypothetical protein